MVSFEQGKIYKGIVTGFSDSTHGLYEIHIPAIMSSDPNYEPIYAKNRTTPYGKWANTETGEIESIGSYLPLQIGMQVEVMFDNKSFASCRIINFWYDNIPLSKDDQESFYLVTKTKNGSMIYSDDKRGITQVIHNGGKTSFLMMDDKISLSVNETSTISNNNLSNIEITEEGIIFKVGKNVVKLDETGFNVSIGKTVMDISEKSTTLQSENLAIDTSKNIELKGNNIFATATEQMNIKSTTTRLTGGQHLAMNGNVINIDSSINTTLQSTQSVNIKSLIHTSIESSIINITSLGTLYCYAPSATYDGLTTVMNGVTTAINGTTVFMDAQVIRGMGAGSSMAATAVGVATATKLAMKASEVAITTAFHFNDPFSGLTANIMTETLTGVAQGCPNQMPIVSMTPSMDYINSTLKYISKGIVTGNIGTVDYISGLQGNHFKKVYMGVDNV